MESLEYRVMLSASLRDVALIGPQPLGTEPPPDVMDQKYGERDLEHPETADTKGKKPGKNDATHTMNNPQPVGVSVQGPGLNESGFIPPDSVGDAGPTQIIMAANGRIKVFDKVTGALGGLNETTDTFFNSVRTSGTSDPHVRYDRLSGRWFITMIDVATVNRVLIAVSTGPTITDHGSFNFFGFQHDTTGGGGSADTGKFADYDTLGVDRFALYVGVNIFNSPTDPLAPNQFFNTTGFVINKANLIAGTLTVTAFRQLIDTNTGVGIYTPQGVDNDNPNATEGYFIGVDNGVFSQLDIRRVINPGGTPTISSNLSLSVPTTNVPFPTFTQPAQGSTRPLDALDDRLFAAEITVNKLTNTASLWTAHNLRVDSTGTSSSGGDRVGSRWYQIGSLAGSPSLTQSGTLNDTVASNFRGFWIPSIAQNGQGAAALGASTAASNQLAGIAVAGRLPTDSLNTLQTFTLAQAGLGTYNVQHGGSAPQRWGDFSQTVVDPNDDMTFWTFQEYANATNSWGVRAIQLNALPPATPSSASSSSINAGASNVNVVVTGTVASGSAFFDPGPDTGGPGFANHITATVNGGGVTVNSVTFTDTTHVTLNITVAPGATAGARTITVTNPDGQSTTSSTGILTVVASPGGITGTVFEDRLSNGVLDGSDAVLSGVTVFLDTNNDGMLNGVEPSTLTNGSGVYTFSGLAAGTYHVRHTPLANYIGNSPLGSAADVVVNTSVVTQNFGDFRIVFLDNGADNYLVRLDSATQTKDEILIGGVLTWSIGKSTLDFFGLTFNTGAGNDLVTVDYTSGNPVPSPGLTYNAGSQTSADALSIIGSAGADSATFAVGSVTIGSGVITHSGTVEAITFDGKLGDDIVAINGGAAVSMPANQRFASLSINGGSAVVPANGSRVINTGTLSITGGGSLDLSDNDMIIRSGTVGAWNGTNYDGVTGLVKQGYNNGAWNGNGIFTSQTAAVAARARTTLGVAQASDAFNISASSTALFDSQTVLGSAILVKYTWSADANLSGVVTGDDYFKIDNGFAAHTTGYVNGDFNFNGIINADDYFLIDQTYSSQGGPL